MSPSKNNPGPSASRRAAVRQHQEQAAAAAKRRKTLLQVGIVAGVAVVAIAIVITAVLVGRSGTNTGGGGGGGGAAPQVSGNVTVAGASVPFAVDGTAFRVGPADAKAKVDLWVDYSCPHCQEYEAANNDVLNQLVAGGDVSVSYHNIQIVTGYGTQAGSTSACVAANDTAKWPTINAALYANHTQETDGWSANQFADWAAQQGAGDQAQQCIREQRYTGWIASNTQASVGAGVQGTPTLFLNGQQQTQLPSGAALTQAVESLAGR